VVVQNLVVEQIVVAAVAEDEPAVAAAAGKPSLDFAHKNSALVAVAVAAVACDIAAAAA